MKHTILIALLLTSCGSERSSASGTVIGKQYNPSTLSMSTGYVVGSNGSVSPVFSSTGESEKWVVIVRTESGKTVAVETNSSYWGTVENGSRVTVETNSAWHGEYHTIKP